MTLKEMLSNGLSKTREVWRVMMITRQTFALVFDAHPVFAALTLVLQIITGMLPVAQLLVFKLLIDGIAKAAASVHPVAQNQFPSFAEMMAAVGIPMILGAGLELLAVILYSADSLYRIS
jgi:hypothetical protein